jgi:hypothetical protein
MEENLFRRKDGKVGRGRAAVTLKVNDGEPLSSCNHHWPRFLQQHQLNSNKDSINIFVQTKQMP